MKSSKRTKSFRQVIACMLAVVMLVLTANVGSAEAAPAEQDYQIVISPDASDMQEYSAKELQKYLFQLFGESFPIVEGDEGTDVSHAFVLGTKENELLQPIAKEMEEIGEQGYVLKTLGDTMYIGGYDDEGMMYGVYGLLMIIMESGSIFPVM